MLTSDVIMSIININKQNIEEFHVTKIALFGSYARNEQNETSDLDILVEFEEGQETFDNYMDLKFFLEDLFNKKVDLVILSSIKPTLKPSILRSVKYAT